MIKMITPDTISFRATVTETEIRERIAAEVLEHIGGLDQAGKPLPGIKVTVKRGPSRQGGYTVDVTGPAPARIALPGGNADHG
jgi:hypothetical protein